MKIALIAGGSTAESQGTLGSATQLGLAASSLGHQMEVLELSATRNKSEIGEVLDRLTAYDLAIPLVSGLEGTLELSGAPYVGSPPDAAGIAANKAAFNAVVKGRGYNKVPYDVVWKRDTFEFRPSFSSPWYTKPARLGASFGMSRVTKDSELNAALERAFSHDEMVVVEQEVPRPFAEIEVAMIVGSGDPLAFAAEIQAPGALWRDEKWKYSMDERPVIINDPYVVAKCVSVARDLAHHIGLQGAFRFDFFLSQEKTLYVGEVNALPGHGKASMFPRILDIHGYPRPTQLELLIEAALQNHETSQALRVRG